MILDREASEGALRDLIHNMAIERPLVKRFGEATNRERISGQAVVRV